MTEADKSRMLADFIAEGEVDYVGLWQVALAVKRAGVTAQEDVRTESLELVRRLFQMTTLSVGWPDREGGFKPWDTSPEDAIGRIEFEWRHLGESPGMGDIAWLKIDPK